jgi:quercetin dioxygenase-like cupin family protein
MHFRLFCLFILLPFTLFAQVQVSKEPLHKKVMENQYFRLLDVKLKPGDTTQFHIHSLPSVFVRFTSNQISTQLEGQSWNAEQNKQGEVSFKQYGIDSIIHRVANVSDALFHVTDMELLIPYKSKFPFHPLPFKELMDNERVAVYQLDAASFKDKVTSIHGPILAELVKGSEVVYADIVTKKSITMKEGKYLYIPAGNTFSFSTKAGEEINMILIEIK